MQREEIRGEKWPQLHRCGRTHSEMGCGHVCVLPPRHSYHVDTIESQLRLVALSQSCLACVRVCEGNEHI